MIQIEITTLEQMMTEVCRNCALPSDVTKEVVAHFIRGELLGKTTHGLAKFCFESQFFEARENAPEVIRADQAIAIVDAHREVGPVSAAFASDLSCELAGKYGVGLVGMINTQRYGVLSEWAERAADRGFISLIMNTSKAECTVDGVAGGLTGVNTIGFGAPTLGDCFSFDMGTTVKPLGLLWEARRGADDLPGDAFVDRNGTMTDDPHSAESALIFGGYKGFCISLLVQYLIGAPFGFPMGRSVTGTWDTGYVFLTIAPIAGSQAARTANTEFMNAVSETLAASESSVRVPGEHSRRKLRAALDSGYTGINDNVWKSFVELHTAAMAEPDPTNAPGGNG
ncbi:Ldh family oxidoreductase [Nocardia sp. NPDC005978]|uniref:Ldh family oxidoreductase n=1 Tax=Nocardia sp. NPDC005978 TaxID=3156725 RepID=UPI0033AA0C17